MSIYRKSNLGNTRILLSILNYRPAENPISQVCILKINMGNIVAQLQVPIPRTHINISPVLAVQFVTRSGGESLTPLTAFLALIAHSSNVSAASNFPCLLNNAPKFFSVVVTVVLQKAKYISFRIAIHCM